MKQEMKLRGSSLMETKFGFFRITSSGVSGKNRDEGSSCHNAKATKEQPEPPGSFNLSSKSKMLLPHTVETVP